VTKLEHYQDAAAVFGFIFRYLEQLEPFPSLTNREEDLADFVFNQICDHYCGKPVISFGVRQFVIHSNLAGPDLQ